MRITIKAAKRNLATGDVVITTDVRVGGVIYNHVPLVVVRPAPSPRRAFVAKCLRDGDKARGYARAADYEVTE